MPKKARAAKLSDLHPVALTSAVMTSFERLVLRHLLKHVGTGLDQLQFAYKAKKGVEDAGLFLLHSITEHIDKRP